MGAREVTFEQVNELPAEWSGVVPPEYVDHNGHMNIERYFEVHCLALSVMFDSHLGVDEAYRARYRQGLFTVEQHLRYLAEAVAGERIAVHTRVLGRSDKTLHLISYLVNLDRRQVTNTIELTAAHVDLVTRRATAFTPALAADVDRQLALAAALSWNALTCGVMGPRRSRAQSSANYRSESTSASTSARP